MRTFAHWKNIVANLGITGPDGSHRRSLINLQTGPGIDNDIQFIVDIPESVTRDEVVAFWVLERGVLVDEETDGIGFKEDWPPEVNRQFDEGHGDRHKWPLKPGKF